MAEFIFLFIIFGIAVWVLGSEAEKKMKNMEGQINERIKEDLIRHEFNSTKEYLNMKSGMGIYYDDRRKKIAVLRYRPFSTLENLILGWQFINCADIIESEVKIDNISVTKTARGSQLGGAIIGGVVAGGVGAVIGGATGSKKTSDKIKSIELQMIINDSKDPIQKAEFLKLLDPKSKDDLEVKNALASVESFHKTLSVLIKQQESDKSTLQHTTHLDELRKLSELYKDGILTEEEFNQQKIKLLS
ncbi:SHOCT domain-containing protein [Rossellomorea arthrocnemi]